MAVAYFHGAEVTEVKKGPVPVKVVKSAVIGLVGTSSRGTANVLTWVRNPQEAEAFGDFQLEGRTGENYTIAKSLKAIFDQGVANVLVVDIAAATIKTAVTAESHTVDANGNFKSTFIPFKPGTNAVTVTDNASPVVTLVEGTDYTHDGYGNFTIITGGALSPADTVLITYAKCDFSGITASTVIGTVNSSTGVKTGLKLYQNSFGDFKFLPKMFVVPKYGELTTVQAQLAIEADTYKAVAFADIPYGTSVATAIAGRQPGGSTYYYSTSERLVFCYDDLIVPNPADLNTTVDTGSLALHYAAVQAAVDNNEGYWVSASNHEMKNVFGTKFKKAGAGLFDTSSQANALNEVGIVTVEQGNLTWGNSNASWPTNTTPSHFIAVRRTADVVYESLIMAMIQFLDKPITPALIDAIKESGNAFIRARKQEAALLEGSKITFDPTKNPTDQIALGKLKFDLVLMSPVPAERITIEAFIDSSLLSSLYKAAA